MLLVLDKKSGMIAMTAVRTIMTLPGSLFILALPPSQRRAGGADSAQPGRETIVR